MLPPEAKNLPFHLAIQLAMALMPLDGLGLGLGLVLSPGLGLDHDSFAPLSCLCVVRHPASLFLSIYFHPILWLRCHFMVNLPKAQFHGLFSSLSANHKSKIHCASNSVRSNATPSAQIWMKVYQSLKLELSQRCHYVLLVDRRECDVGLAFV